MRTSESVKTITETIEATDIRLNQFSESGANCHVDFSKTFKDSTGETLKTEGISVHIGADAIGALAAFSDAYKQLKALSYAELDKVIAQRVADLKAQKAAEDARKAAQLAEAKAIVDAAAA